MKGTQRDGAKLSTSEHKCMKIEEIEIIVTKLYVLIHGICQTVGPQINIAKEERPSKVR